MLSAAWRGCLMAGQLLLLTAAVAPMQLQAQAHPAHKPGGDRATVDDQEARDLFRLGKQAFDEGRYERALKYFKDAYDLSHRAALLSNIGTALDRLRRDQEALEAYRSYLAQVPDASNRAFIEERVAVIEAAMSKSGGPAVAAPSPVPPPTAAEPVPTPADAARASAANTSAPTAPTEATTATTAPATNSARDSGGLTSRWWFWAGLGAIAAGAVVVGVAAGSSSGSSGVEPPAVLSSATRVRQL